MGHRKNYGRNYFLNQSIQSHRNLSNGFRTSPPSPSLRPLSHSSPVRQSSTRAPRRSLWGNGSSCNNCSANEDRPTLCGRNKHYKWPMTFSNMKSLSCLSLGSNGIKSISTNEESIKDSSVGSGKKVLPRLSNPLRYKTELCRSFEESGDCRFGQACTFAHGVRELRAVLRHPRYKTDLCRTYHGAGYCQYGARCHFIHDPDEDGIAALRGFKSHSQLDGLSRTVSSMSPKPVNVDNLVIRNLQQFHANKAAEDRLTFLNSSDNSNEQLSSTGYGNEQLSSIGELYPDFPSLNMLTIGQNGLSGSTSESHLQDNCFGISDDLSESSIYYMDMKPPTKEGTEVGRYLLPCSGKRFDATSDFPNPFPFMYLDAEHSSRDIWRLGETSTQNKTVIGNPMEMSRSLLIPSIEELIHMP